MTTHSNAAVKELTITRFYDEPRELVFEAWTNPELLALWWGPEDFTNPVCELDVRPGGTILIHMAAPDGTVIPVKGTYQEVIEPERLVFTTGVFFDEDGISQVEELMTVDFIDKNGKTELVLHISVVKCDPAFIDALGSMESGWTSSLDRMSKKISQRRRP